MRLGPCISLMPLLPLPSPRSVPMLLDYCRSYACFKVFMSSLSICSIACMTLLDFSGSFSPPSESFSQRPTSLRALLQRDHGGQSSILLVFPPGRADGLPECQNFLFQAAHRAPERLLGVSSQQLLRDADQPQSVRFSGLHQSVAE